MRINGSTVKFRPPALDLTARSAVDKYSVRARVTLVWALVLVGTAAAGAFFAIFALSH